MQQSTTHMRAMDRLYGVLMIFAGAGGVALGVFEYYDLRRWEAEGGHKTVHALVMMMYDVGGPVGVASGMALLGVLLFVGGIFLIAKPRAALRGAR